MAQRGDVFYGLCTFWTGDWDWLREKNGYTARPLAPLHVGVLQRVLGAPQIPGPRGRALRAVEQPQIPHCPFCGSVGFEADREQWLQQAREWDNGTSPKAPGVPHPGYVDMILWSEKQCFPHSAALEAAYAARPAPRDEARGEETHDGLHSA